MKLALLLLLSTSASAHPQDMGFFGAKVDGVHVSAELRLEPAVAERVAALKNDDNVQAIFDATLGEIAIREGSQVCAWRADSLSSTHEEGKLVLKAEAICPGGGDLDFDLGFLNQAPKGFELLARVAGTQGINESVLTEASEHVFLGGESSHSFGQFVFMGVQHIGATPDQWVDRGHWHFPDGIDHILFVVALVLGGGGLIGLVKTVTGFTIGHSLTLAAATFGVVHVPSRIVESAIALSIAIVAAEGVFLKNPKGRWKISLAFGLVHGLGFASALAELHLSRSSLFKALVGFNVGVEIGQAAVVIAVYPLYFLLKRYEPTRRFAIPVCALAVFSAGAVWFVQRAFLGA
jgi:hypothetical protein